MTSVVLIVGIESKKILSDRFLIFQKRSARGGSQRSRDEDALVKGRDNPEGVPTEWNGGGKNFGGTLADADRREACQTV